MRSVLPLVENLGTELEHGKLQNHWVGEFPVFGFDPAFQGVGLDGDASRQKATTQEGLLGFLMEARKRGERLGKFLLLGGKHGLNSFVISFCFVTRNRGGHHKEVVA